MFKEMIDRILRRAVTSVGAGAVVSGDQAAITVGTLMILAEFGFETWRTRRAAKKAAKSAKE
jgi:hypothetical protein